ncbi:MAG: hypothetical protein KKE05_04470 [Nanoarchaeota archaeon]|nr:hypothetical protein [Nanoarchaeota archaeon]
MKNLIIKTGALGDVLRTTVLLRELKGEVYWLAAKSALPLLTSKRIKEVLLIDSKEDTEGLRKMSFDLVISLEEDESILHLVGELEKKKLIGLFLNEKGETDYTPESAHWFDMSLVSKKGKEEADRLKRENRKSLQQILIEMVGGKFENQDYDFAPPKKSDRIGLVSSTGRLWPNKMWAGFTELFALLKNEGYDVRFLGRRETLEEHIEDIKSCDLIVCGDTLGMHLALAMKKKTVVLFNCTPPQEIHDYGRAIKIMSPLCNKYLYKREFNREAINAIKPSQVLEAVKTLLENSNGKG